MVKVCFGRGVDELRRSRAGEFAIGCVADVRCNDWGGNTMRAAKLK